MQRRHYGDIIIDWTDEEARKIDEIKASQNRRVRDKQKKIDEPMKNLMRELRAEGMSLRAIARRLRVGDASVRRVLTHVDKKESGKRGKNGNNTR
jgi:DNA invertase Pin-like site-specific DNA recombinase